MLNDWLNYSERLPPPYGNFRLIDVTEKDPVPADLDVYLSKELLEAYRNLDFLKFQYQHEPEARLLEYLNNYVFPEDQGFGRSVRSGDFGETLASLIVSHFEGLVVPIHKIRWKFNRNKSVFCTDMIAHNGGDEISDVHYYEVKCRQTIQRNQGNYICVEAHNGLVSDQNANNDAIADHLSKVFYELNDLDNAAKYGDLVKNPSNYNKHFELFFVIETAVFIADILDELHALPPTLTPLNVTVVLIHGIRDRIHNSFNLANATAADIVYDR